MIWATVSSRSCFCWLYRASPSLAAKNIISLISVLTVCWCPCVVFSCVVGRGCLLWPVCSLGKTLLAFALLHFVLHGQICLLLQVFLTRLSDFTLTFHFHALEKEMAPHSSVLAWKIPGMGEPGGLPSMGSHRVGHDWRDLAAAAAAADLTPHFILNSVFTVQILQAYGCCQSSKSF